MQNRRELKDEITIIDEASEIQKIVDTRRELATNLGLSEEIAKTGLVFEDEYILVYRDPVKFPSGKLGTYIRVVERESQDGPSGVVILPMCDGQIFLNRIFRHSTSSWEVEVPRGFMEKGLNLKECVEKEIHEEIGLGIKNLIYLGQIKPNTGLLSGYAEAFFAELDAGEQKPNPESEEVFGETLRLSSEDLYSWVRGGKISDGFTLSAILLAECLGLLKSDK